MHSRAHQLGAGPQILWELITNKPELSLHFHAPRGMQPECFLQPGQSISGMTAHPDTAIAVSAHSQLVSQNLPFPEDHHQVPAPPWNSAEAQQHS